MPGATWKNRPCNAEERFWKRVQKADSCWLWTGFLNKAGYGRFRGYRIHDRHVLAHRFSYELAKGPIPEGLVLDHLCRNPRCVNPDHLEPVTPRENAARGLINGQAQRDNCVHGHRYTPENTRYDLRGHRVCRKCQCNYQAAARGRRVAMGLPANPYKKPRRDGQMEMDT